MGIVAFTRELGSLGTFIAERLAERRGYRYVRREVLEEAARVGEVSEEHLLRSVEHPPGLWERLSLPARRNFHHVAARVLEFAAADDVVLLGRWSTMLLRGVRHAVRVRVCAPPEVRIARLMERLAISRHEAQALAQRYDTGVRARLRQFFDVEWEDADLYDLVLNTERIEVEQACDLIERLLDSPAFQPDNASRQEVADRALAARVAEALKMDDRLGAVDLQVTARAGVITLAGIVFDPDQRAAALAVARGVPHVAAVTDEITVARMPVR
ncbi:MAG: cytidylate kinase family protein [Armatimonadota bacterium]|nr:cytidylate kinase family protein [Armatimonadota bacterium]MDR7485896.1 cytidylate kinase family protein [Armatimonadota bacterium]MDR7533153.1 cytidylate kinase family protein [Armatimonadota bacterium]MDR7536601.1 cytidylate kinase family protein [Armatimonadota bacterium]